MFQLYAILSLGYLCIVLQGYDGALMTSINAMVRDIKGKIEKTRENFGLRLLASVSAILPSVSSTSCKVIGHSLRDIADLDNLPVLLPALSLLSTISAAWCRSRLLAHLMISLAGDLVYS